MLHCASPRRFRRASVLAAAALVVASGCQDGDDSARTPEATAPASSELRSTSAAPATTAGTPVSITASTTASTTSATTGGTSPVTGSASECATIAPLPAAASALSTAAADVDADGTPDELTAYAADRDPGEGDWHLRVDFGGGGGSDLTLTDNPAPGAVRVLGTAPIGPDDDPTPGGLRPTIFVWTGSGASARTIGLFRVDGCELTSVTLEGGPASFVVGASVGHQEGLRCEAVAGATVIVEVLAEPDASGTGHNVTTRAYTRAGQELVPHGEVQQTVSATPPPEAGQILGCGDVSG